MQIFNGQYGSPLAWMFLFTVVVVLTIVWRRQNRRLDGDAEREFDRISRERNRINRHVRSAVMYFIEEQRSAALSELETVVGPCCGQCRQRIDWCVNGLIEDGLLATEDEFRFTFNQDRTRYVLTPSGARILKDYGNLPMEEDPLILPRSKVQFSHQAWHESL